MLPDMEGYEVCQRMRRITFAPIIFLSAKSDEIDKLLGLGIGGDDYVTKPFSTKEVVFRIKAQLRRNSYSAQSSVDDDKIEFGDVVIFPNKGEVKKRRSTYSIYSEGTPVADFPSQSPESNF